MGVEKGGGRLERQVLEHLLPQRRAELAKLHVRGNKVHALARLDLPRGGGVGVRAAGGLWATLTSPLPRGSGSGRRVREAEQRKARQNAELYKDNIVDVFSTCLQCEPPLRFS